MRIRARKHRRSPFLRSHLKLERLESRLLLAVDYRVNVGGPALAGDPIWQADSSGSPSGYVNSGAIHSDGTAIDMSDSSIPPGTPEAMFQTERFDWSGGAEMQWDFPVSPGTYEVRLYFADIYAGTHFVGARVFDVLIESDVVLDNYDIFAEVGGFAGVMKSFIVEADSNLDIDFGHVTENPTIKGIEIESLEPGANTAPTATNLAQTHTYAQGTASVALNNIVVSDPDAGEAITAQLTLSIPATGSLTTGTFGGTTSTYSAGVWQAIGPVSEVNAALAAVAFVPAAGNSLDATIATHVEDAAGAGPADGIITLDVTIANTTPTATNLTQTHTYAQGTASVALNNIVVSDPDAGEAITAQLTLSIPATGSLTTGTFGGTTSTYSAGVWQAIGPVSEVNAALAAVAFVPAAGNSLDATIATHVEDAAGAGPADGVITLDVTVPSPPSGVVYRVNAGGFSLAGDPIWQGDSGSFVNTGSTFSTSTAIDMSHGSLPSGLFPTLFQSERFDFAGGAEMQWDFPVTPGSYEVRLYFAEIYSGAQAVAARVFDVSIEGDIVLDNYDVFAEVGGYAGVMQSFIVDADANMDIDFGHVVENPAIKGIEILSLSSGSNTTPSATNLTQTHTYAQGTASVALNNIVVTDSDAGEIITAQLTLSNPATGSLTTGTFGGTTSTYSAGLWQAVGPVSEVNAALAAVAFVPAAGNTLDATIATHVEDATGAGPADGLITLDVIVANTAPTATNLTQTHTYAQGTASVALNNIVVSDPDAGEAITAQLTLSNPATGSLTTGTFGGTTSTYSAGLWQAIGPVSEVNAALAAVSFLPAAGNTLDATIATHVEDAAGAGPADGVITLDVTVAPPSGGIVYRVNAGGPALAGSPAWEADTATYVNTGSTFSDGTTIDMSDASLPPGTPSTLFQTERWDPSGGAEMQWDFSVTPGSYEVRLYFADIYTGTQFVGARVFDVSIEGDIVLDDYDIFADVSGYTGVMKSFVVESDANLDIDFGHVTENPAIKGIEILSTAAADTLVTNPTSVEFGNVSAGETESQTVTLINAGAPGDPSITISDLVVTGGSGAFTATLDAGGPVTIAPGASTTVTVEFAPTDEVLYAATLSVVHSGSNALALSLSGDGGVAPVGFGKSELAGANITTPTSLQFGPDGRLYAAQQDGEINVYEVTRSASNSYSVTSTEIINLVKDIPNHSDSGVPQPFIDSRLVTGLYVTGTASNPILYVSSSDPRIGAGPSGTDLNLDTNSGILSRLTFDGEAWEKVDLVRGLARSEENHGPNGLLIDPATNTLLLTSGGNTNMGAPSNNFALLSEFALSAAILSIDLDAIDAMPTLTDVNGQQYKYDLPTLDDEDRDFDGSGSDVNLASGIQDVFGGNNGQNQAILAPDSPVQIYAPGFRNPYDIVLSSTGDLWTVDNGANSGWGDVPILDPVTGLATNQVNEPGVTTLDNLQRITGPGYYGGHPNPVRANVDVTFNASNPQSPVALVGGNAVESFFEVPQGPDALATFNQSTNGLAEYTASNFGGQMQGDLLTVTLWGGNAVHRLSPNASGDALDLHEILVSNVGSAPLDIIAVDDFGLFPGTVWIADHGMNAIIILEPNDFDGNTGGGCAGDADCDGYSDDDELANGTNPNSSADTPPDVDEDFLSDLLDDDDDNDSQLDHQDPFAVDPANGTTTPLNTMYTWENDAPAAGGLLNLGFTGLMTNGVDDYQDLFDTSALTAGGAAGVLTIDQLTDGTALGATNTQEQAFQFAVNTSGAVAPFVARTSVGGPFAGVIPQAGQEMGFFIGTGDQDNYVKLVLTGNSGGTVEVTSELGAVATNVATDALSMPGPDFVDLFFTIDPVALTVQAGYRATTGGVAGSEVALGSPISIPASWLSEVLAIGVISTGGGASSPVSASWDFLGFDAPSTASADVVVNAGGTIHNSSTFTDGSFQFTNTSPDGRQIERILIDLSHAIFPDMVFDPDGIAGDPAGKGFTPNAGAAATGVAGFTYMRPHDDGFDVLEIQFDDFDPGEFFSFSIDIDPTSIRGAAQPGPAESGSVSGLELAGSLVEIEFSDGVVLTSELFGTPSSVIGSQNTLGEAPPAMPAMQVVGVGSTPTVVSSASQTVRISGPVGATVRLSVIEGGLYLSGVPGGGFDIDPFESNKAIVVNEYGATIGSSGMVDIPVTLTKTGAEGGINHLAAVLVDGSGRTGPLAKRVLEYDPAAAAPLSADLVAPHNSDDASGESQFELHDVVVLQQAGSATSSGNAGARLAPGADYSTSPFSKATAKSNQFDVNGRLHEALGTAANQPIAARLAADPWASTSPPQGKLGNSFDLDSLDGAFERLAEDDSIDWIAWR